MIIFSGNKRENIIYGALTLMISGLYMIFIYNKTFPLTEGWYTYYAQLINSGQKSYIDFEYLFWPLYMEFIAFVTKYLGYNIIVLRILGGGYF